MPRLQFSLRSLFVLASVAAVEFWFLASAIPNRHFQPDDDFMITVVCVAIAGLGYAAHRAVKAFTEA